MHQEKRSIDTNPNTLSDNADVLDAFFSNKSKEDIVSLFLSHLQQDNDLTDDQIHKLLATYQKRTNQLLPISIFNNQKLSALETITKYLKENKSMAYSEIAALLNRDQRTIWATYSKAKKKRPAGFAPAPSEIFIPASMFADRTLSVLETLTTYLREELELRLNTIAKLLNRDNRTIWTVYHRSKKKRGQ